MAIGNPDDPPQWSPSLTGGNTFGQQLPALLADAPQWSPPLTGGNTPNPLDSGCAVSSAAIEPPLTDENTYSSRSRARR